MKEHEFKIRFDKATGEWRVWVKVPFLFFWTCWRVVFKSQNGIYGNPFFDSERDCEKGIEKWKLENAPGYERYNTTHRKL